MKNIEEILRKADKVADLRKKETLSLIETTKNVLSQIAQHHLYGEVEIKTEDNNQGYTTITYFRTLNGSVEIGNYWDCDETKKRENKFVIAYDEKKYDTYRIPGPNEYGIPENYRLELHNTNIPDPETYEKLHVAYYPEPNHHAVYVPGKWFVSLPFHEKEPDTIPRIMWVLIAHHIVELAEDLLKREEKKLSETSNARILVEKLKSAL